MKHKGDLAKGWVLKGDSDLAAAKRIVCSDGPYSSITIDWCYASRQPYIKVSSHGGGGAHKRIYRRTCFVRIKNSIKL